MQVLCGDYVLTLNTHRNPPATFQHPFQYLHTRERDPKERERKELRELRGDGDQG